MFEIVKYAGQGGRDRFDCGKPELNTWLQTQTSQQQKRDNAVTFVALDPSDQRVVGYYASRSYQLDVDHAARAYGVGKKTYPVPALLLAKLAVCGSVQKKGLGEQLLVHALKNFAEIAEKTGVEVIVVHAIDKDAAAFYGRYGFITFESHDLHLFLPMKTIRKLYPVETGV
ncbi:GNAT family N-acetyltransferase [Cryobacterium sp. TMT3-29-2]|uniref:GNAT family N-acetyltransferase n=1 Tax=Cryobacterium sp. TMT3-29-2 TaxID=2555867 RepID=UPI0010733A3F|nr:GNAT family N-acetyltransferase [Cryobacterium sp. TMT3-29-2]TFC87132.1 GNAT family N-acetyltransferase [Cryobacterium sp. TMT3-29-2]